MIKKALVVVLIVLCVFAMFACKQAEPKKGTTPAVGQVVQAQPLAIGAAYSTDNLGFSITLTEYWYKHTRIIEHSDYVVFVFNGETDLAKDVPILYIGTEGALSELNLTAQKPLGNLVAAFSNNIENVTDSDNSDNRDLGIIGILLIEREQVLGTYQAQGE